jgi:adenylosuccinate lyase
MVILLSHAIAAVPTTFSKNLASTMLASQSVVPRCSELGSCARRKLTLQQQQEQQQHHEQPDVAALLSACAQCTHCCWCCDLTALL